VLSGKRWLGDCRIGHFRLGSLVAIVDRNQLSIDGATEDLMGIEPLVDNFTSFRRRVQRVDG